MVEADERTYSQRVADGVAKFGGSWKFILSGAGFILCWVLLNACSYLDIIAFDKYPFILLNLLLSLVAAFQAPFILMSQHRAEVKQDEAYRALFQEIKDLVIHDIEQTKAHQHLLKTIESHEKRSGKRLVNLVRLLAEKKIQPGMPIDLDNPGIGRDGP